MEKDNADVAGFLLEDFSKVINSFISVLFRISSNVNRRPTIIVVDGRGTLLPDTSVLSAIDTLKSIRAGLATLNCTEKIR